MKQDISTLFAVTEIDLIYRHKQAARERPIICDSKTAYDIFLASWDMNKIDLVEHFKVLLMDTKGACLGISNVATGGITQCIVDPRIVFATALKAKATGIIVAHNHPSGCLRPSQDDIRCTESLVSGGKILQIAVHDHIIMAPQGYHSFADHGLMP